MRRNRRKRRCGRLKVLLRRPAAHSASADKREANFDNSGVPTQNTGGFFLPRNRHNGKILIGGAETMRVKITLACTECKRRNYVSKKNKKNDPDRIEMKKHCRFCNKHTLHKETK